MGPTPLLTDVAFDRLAARLLRGQTPGTHCWEWDGALSPRGYGRIAVPSALRGVFGHATTTARAACHLWHGPRPEGMQVRHLCGAKNCHNPQHLTWGTPKENTNDQFGHGTIPLGESRWNNRWSSEQIRHLRGLAAGGSSYAEFIDSIGMTRHYARAVIRGAKRPYDGRPS